MNFKVVPSQTFSCLIPTVTFERISFNDELRSRVSKQEDHPSLFKQMTEDVINDIPPEALVTYTDDGKLDDGRAESGVLISNSEGFNNLSIRNPDYCCVFRSEITAIGKVLDHFD